MKELQDYPIAAVVITPGRKVGDAGVIKGLASSIEEIGLLHPISVTQHGRLIAGMKRLAAFKRLGRTHIPAFIHDVDMLHAELAEIDENLQRHTMTALEHSEALKRWKQIYEALHPETKAGKAGGHAKHGSANDNLSFADDAAEKTGQSARTVQRAVEVAEKISDEAADLIRDTPVADNRSELKRLADLPEPEQVKAAEAIASGKAKSVSEAIGDECPRGGKHEPDADGDCRKCYEPGVGPASAEVASVADPYSDAAPGPAGVDAPADGRDREAIDKAAAAAEKAIGVLVRTFGVLGLFDKYRPALDKLNKAINRHEWDAPKS